VHGFDLPPEGVRLGDLESHLIRQALRRSRGQLRPAARLLGISYKTLQYRIRKYGLDSDDPALRDVVLPMLRVIQHPEATQMIANEYYRAIDEAEQMMFLEAMSHEYHDPRQAAVWAIDRALNSESAENRERALDLIQHYAVDDDLISDTAIQIYESTTRPEQRMFALGTVALRGDLSPVALRFLRRSMREPRADELMVVVSTIENWGDENDAARLEALADEFPAIGEVLRERAKAVRRLILMRRGEPEAAEAELRAETEQREREAEEAERRRREEEGEGEKEE